MTHEQRTDELAANLDAVRRRLADACAAAARDPRDVTLIAVSKTRPAGDVLIMHSLGVSDFGESYDQEATAKAASLAAMGVDIRWHFVGRLQRNKCASIARYAAVVHAIDRRQVVDALARAAIGHGRLVRALVQVSLDGDTGRGGARIGDVSELAAEVAAADGLVLGGLMAIPPVGADAAAAFATLAQISAELRAEHPGAVDVSAGMTGDLESAVAHGSTCVRVGTALFGRRPHALH